MKSHLLNCRTYVAVVVCWAIASDAGGIPVPNASFESPDVSGEVFFAGPIMDFWQKTPEPPGYDTNVFGAWEEKSGVFFNVPFPQPIANVDGAQAAFLFSFPGVGFFQDYDSVGGTNAEPERAFDAVYEVGRQYQLTAGFTTSSSFPVSEGATMQMRLYYRNSESNRVTAAATTVTFSTNMFTNIFELVDFHLSLPRVQADDPWAGRNIGIEFLSTVAPELIGGVWDIDHIRLSEFVPSTLADPAWSDGEFQFTLLSEPGLPFEVLSSTNVSLPLEAWSSERTVINATGTLTVQGLPGGDGQRYFTVRQLP